MESAIGRMMERGIAWLHKCEFILRYFEEFDREPWFFDLVSYKLAFNIHHNLFPDRPAMTARSQVSKQRGYDFNQLTTGLR